MPVVTVLVAPHPQVGALLVHIADAIAAALDLGAGDVIATHVATGLSAKSGSVDADASSAWPLVSIHGSGRGAEATHAARTAAEGAVLAWCTQYGIACEGVWTEWLS
jgi:hypothetical protein